MFAAQTTDFSVILSSSLFRATCSLPAASLQNAARTRPILTTSVVCPGLRDAQAEPGLCLCLRLPQQPGHQMVSVLTQRPASLPTSPRIRFRVPAAALKPTSAISCSSLCLPHVPLHAAHALWPGSHTALFTLGSAVTLATVSGPQITRFQYPFVSFLEVPTSVMTSSSVCVCRCQVSVCVPTGRSAPPRAWRPAGPQAPRA